MQKVIGSSPICSTSLNPVIPMSYRIFLLLSFAGFFVLLLNQLTDYRIIPIRFSH